MDINVKLPYMNLFLIQMKIEINEPFHFFFQSKIKNDKTTCNLVRSQVFF